MEILDLLLPNVIPILAILGGGVAWFFDKKKRREEIDRLKSESKITEANALKEMQSVYNVFVGDVRVQISELKQQIVDLRIENKELTHKVSILVEELEKQKK